MARKKRFFDFIFNTEAFNAESFLKGFTEGVITNTIILIILGLTFMLLEYFSVGGGSLGVIAFISVVICFGSVYKAVYIFILGMSLKEKLPKSNLGLFVSSLLIFIALSVVYINKFNLTNISDIKTQSIYTITVVIMSIQAFQQSFNSNSSMSYVGNLQKQFSALPLKQKLKARFTHLTLSLIPVVLLFLAKNLIG